MGLGSWALLVLARHLASPVSSSASGSACGNVLLQRIGNLKRGALITDRDLDEVAALDCYGEFANLVVEEGNEIGAQIYTRSAEECKSSCSDTARCKSFAICPQWNGCWMKDRGLVGSEPTRTLGDCKTYYKTSCNGIQTPSPTPARATGGVEIVVASYNLFWWNAFGANPWKGSHITNNIKDTLKADVLGLQECDNPGLIRDRTGYTPASPFAGAQGIVVKPGLFRVDDSGSQDIQATGKWGPRHVTWAKLIDHASGHTFWHFNTHWCVHSGNGRSCSANKRYIGARNMLRIIQEKAGNAPVIITGDFNAHLNEPGPQHFLQNGFSIAVDHWVDVIFYSKDHWHVRRTSVGDAAHSDHRPVVAELQLLLPSSPSLSPTTPRTCYGEFAELVVDEGNEIGAQIYTRSAEECKSSCSDATQCRSFAICPQWNGCWMKDRNLIGSEPTKTLGDCKTFYKMPCDAPER